MVTHCPMCSSDITLNPEAQARAQKLINDLTANPFGCTEIFMFAVIIIPVLWFLSFVIADWSRRMVRRLRQGSIIKLLMISSILIYVFLPFVGLDFFTCNVVQIGAIIVGFFSFIALLMGVGSSWVVNDRQ